MRVPSGSRTRVSDVKSRGPGPLDDGDSNATRVLTCAGPALSSTLNRGLPEGDPTPTRVALPTLGRLELVDGGRQTRHRARRRLLGYRTLARRRVEGDRGRRERCLRALHVFRGHRFAHGLYVGADGASNGAVAQSALDALTVTLFSRRVVGHSSGSEQGRAMYKHGRPCQGGRLVSDVADAESPTRHVAQFRDGSTILNAAPPRSPVPTEIVP